MKRLAFPSLSAIACALVIIALPAGVAAQSLALLAAFISSIWIYRRIPQATRPSILASRTHKFALMAFAASISFALLATLMNPQNSNRELIPHAVGFLATVIVPPFLALCWSTELSRKERWLDIFSGVLVVACLACLSQALWGWQMEGSGIAFSPMFKRARGFYSHPLTLAYVLLMIWPLHVVEWLRNWRKFRPWLSLVCLAIMLILSASRVPLLCAALSLVLCVWTLSKGRYRMIMLALFLSLAAGISLTKNPVSTRFAALFAEKNPDRLSDYPDDRLAFWSTFALMIKERPWIGHGINLDRAYRKPYYEANGLGDFKKQYEAHNQFIQIWAEGGILALGAFILWLVLIYRSFPHLDRGGRLILQQSFFVFILGGMTQNAFQDSEVRYVIIVLLSLALAAELRASSKKLPASGLAP